jgi:hypothetical protein
MIFSMSNASKLCYLAAQRYGFAKHARRVQRRADLARLAGCGAVIFAAHPFGRAQAARPLEPVLGGG